MGVFVCVCGGGGLMVGWAQIIETCSFI
jgi:hypothetical protein